MNAASGGHRPYPPPASPWIMRQTWLDLLFAHWRLAPSLLRGLVPGTLPIDTFDGSAWVTVAPFRMHGVRPRFVPPLPGLSAFPELNVRTYVTLGGKPGVCFFSLDAGNPIAVLLARVGYQLPYFRARMSVQQVGTTLHYQSRRTHRGAPPATFTARYGPDGPVFHARRGSLDYFLSERYCMYTVDRGGRPWRAEIDHGPWPLQPAVAELVENTMLAAAGLRVDDTPPRLLHFAGRVDMVAWLPARVSGS